MATEQNNKLELAPIPKTWPGGFGIYKYSKAAVMKNLAIVVGLMVLNGAVSSILNQASKHHAGSALAFGSALDLFIITFFTTATAIVILAGIDGKKVTFGHVISETGNIYWEMLLLLIIQLILLVGSFILFVIPFFFVLPRIALSTYYLVDQKMGAIDALKAAWNDSEGHSLKIWGVMLVTVSFAFLILVLVGIYFLIMYSAALAILYRFVIKSKSV